MLAPTICADSARVAVALDAIARHVVETTSAFPDVLEAVYSRISWPGIGKLFDQLSSASTYEEFAWAGEGAEGAPA
jgi:hypothetical protein